MCYKRFRKFESIFYKMFVEFQNSVVAPGETDTFLRTVVNVT